MYVCGEESLRRAAWLQKGGQRSVACQAVNYSCVCMCMRVFFFLKIFNLFIREREKAQAGGRVRGGERSRFPAEQGA